MAGKVNTQSPAILRKASGAGNIGTSFGITVEQALLSRTVNIGSFADLGSYYPYLGQIVYLTGHTVFGVGAGHFRVKAGNVAAGDGGTLKQSADAGLFFERMYDGGLVNITWFGVVPLTSGLPADTTAIQQSVWDNTAFRAVFYPAGRYAVTKLVQRNTNMGYIYGDNAIMLGVASSPTSCMFELKVGNGFHMYGMKWGGRQNLNYVCGLHWYTNNLSLYYPGKATLDIEIGEFLLGVNVGMLPTQSQYYAQNDPQADGVAIDAPISECSVRLKIQDCPQGIRICQPNGKLTLVDSYIEATAQGWVTPTTQNTWKAMVLERFGELSMVGGSLECISSSTGSLIEQNSGNIMIESVVFESASPIRLSGNYFSLRLSKLLNFGFNNTSSSMFYVKNDAVGVVDVNNSWLAFPYQNMTVGTADLAKGVSNLATLAYAEAPNVLIALNGVELRDCLGKSGGAWQMMARGVKVKYNNVRLTSFENVALEYSKRLVDAKLSNSNVNVLAGLIDSASTTVAAYPVAVPSTTGGWSFASAGGVYSYGSQVPSATLNIETLNALPQTPSKVLRMQANSGVVLTASTPSFSAEPFSYVFVTGWVYVGAGGGATIAVKMELRDFADALLSTVNLQSGAASLLAPGWQPFTAWAQQVAGASKARIVLEVENGVDAQWSDISAYVDK